MASMAAMAFGSPASDGPYLPNLAGIDFRPIFIVGPQRSGTTALYRVLARTGLFNVTTVYHILNRHRLLHLHATAQEDQARDKLTRFFDRKGLSGTEWNSEAVGPGLLEEYCYAFDHLGRWPVLDDRSLPTFTQFCRKLQVIQDPARPLLLKNPYDSANFLYLQEKFPHARYIFIYRHPADIITSALRLMRGLCARRDEYAALLLPRYDRLSRSPVALELARRICSDRFPLLLRQATAYVTRSCGYMAANRGRLGAAAIGVTYTELCDDPNRVVRHVLDFLGLQEQAPHDYSTLIRRREPAVLPEVRRELVRVEERNALYLRAAGIRIPMQLAP